MVGRTRGMRNVIGVKVTLFTHTGQEFTASSLSPVPPDAVQVPGRMADVAANDAHALVVALLDGMENDR